MFRPWRRTQAAKSPGQSRNRKRTTLSLLSLEARVVPTIDIILDFDGGTLQSGLGYNFPAGFGGGGGDTFTRDHAVWAGARLECFP